MSVFSFSDDNFSKCQWNFTKLGVCIDIMEICIGVANSGVLSFHIFHFLLKILCCKYSFELPH